jgi:hypothetical protein
MRPTTPLAVENGVGELAAHARRLTRAVGSGGLRKEVSKMKDVERRDKVSVRTGKDTRSGQDP